jgi:RNA polymerase sigma-70 factor (ECF subfamily)
MAQEDESRSLVHEAQKGDESAFEELGHRYRDRLLSIVQSRIGIKLRGKIEAEDIVQETLLRAWRTIRSFEWRGPGSFAGWLTRIAEHLIWNASQKYPRAELSLRQDLKDTATSPEQSMRRNERFDRLEEAMTGLSPEQREAVRLSRIERLKVAEIAERMGKSPASVKMMLSRSRRKLKETFGDTESLHLPDRELKVEEPDHGVG